VLLPVMMSPLTWLVLLHRPWGFGILRCFMMVSQLVPDALFARGVLVSCSLLVLLHLDFATASGTPHGNVAMIMRAGSAMPPGVHGIAMKPLFWVLPSSRFSGGARRTRARGPAGARPRAPRTWTTTTPRH
jgi:hypothetical protein